MKKSKYLLWGLASATGVFIYVSAIAWLIFNAPKIFGELDSFLTPLFVLLLLVISASITGLMVFGKPISLYLDNHKKEAFSLLFITLSCLILFATGLVIVLLLR
ncbi:MAG: hypothetical protein A2119_02655 [Candidatus Colwellbacteria bacterium GWA2_46_10]|uniref:Uncharacterized protein n=1 Tax=Candidatus Colwellbacteria bacterium GWA2_46_10 TaxID=1797684 RepID=A0A1G1YXA0_9BACT|nr:MAG: hypothetical protein A2119_02655 [Candidatus Colwellbacteria bacterium GWA2_46_10]